MNIKQTPQWLLWRFEDGRKIPINKWGDRSGSTFTDDYLDYEKAVEASNRLVCQGVAFCFTKDDPFIGIDLDDCMLDPYTPKDWAEPIVDRFSTYTELSPSLTGLKLYGIGEKPEGMNSRVKVGDGSIEVYEHGRFFTFTELQVGSSSVAEVDVAWLYETYWSKESAPETRSIALPGSGTPLQERALAYIRDADKPTPGGRNSACFRLAGHLAAMRDNAGSGLSGEDVEQLCQQWNASLPIPMDETEVSKTVANNLKSATPRAEKLPEVPVPQVYDDVDISGIVEANRDVTVAGGTKEDGWGQPDPLPERAKVMPFRIELLPKPLRKWVQDISDRMQCPPDFPAVAMICALSSMIGQKVCIRPKRHDDWSVVANLWGFIVGRPGLMKTPCVQQATAHLRKFEFDAAEEFNKSVEILNATSLVEEEKVRLIKEEIKKRVKAKDEDGAKQVEKELLEARPKQPVATRYIVNMTTVEKLHDLLSENPNGLFVLRDEISGMLSYLEKEEHAEARKFMLESWDGNSSVTIDRIGRGTIRCENAITSVFGGIQPSNLQARIRKIQSGHTHDDGLLQRFQLAVWPDVEPEFINIDRFPDSFAKSQAGELFDRFKDLKQGEVGLEGLEGEPPYVRFSPEAQELFDSWRCDLEKAVRSDEHPETLQSHFAKYRSLIPSLALIDHLSIADANEVSVDSLKRAIAWSDYLKSHALRIYGIATDPDANTARLIGEKILSGKVASEFKVKDIRQKGWSGLTETVVIKSGLARLSEMNWVRLAPNAQPSKGGRPSETFEINPAIFENSPKSQPSKPSEPI